MNADALGGSPAIPESTPAVPALDKPALSGSEERRVLGALCVSAFMAALNFFAPTPFYPQMARDLQAAVSILGQAVTLMALISAGLGLIVGPLADRYGYRMPLVAGLLAIAVTFLGTGLAPNYAVLLGMSVAGGLGDALAFALPLAVASAYFRGDAQRRAIGLTIAALSSAPILGSPLLTAIGGAAGWRVALGSAALAGAGAAWFVATSLPADAQRPATPLRLSAIIAAYAPLLRHAPTVRLFGISALRGIWWIALLTYLGAFLGNVAGLSTGRIGLVYAVTGGAYAAGSIAAGRHRRLASRPVLGIACLVAALLVIPLLAFHAPWLIIPPLLAVSLTAALSGVAIPALLASESPAGAGTTMVLNGSILNLGAAAGAALGGLLIGVGGYPTLGIGAALVALLAAGLALWPTAH